MSSKVDHTSAVEPHSVKMSGTTTPSAAPTSGPKASMFAAKSGFVIPKNKLSGSLVPIFRGVNKQGSSGKVNEESTKQVQRKTKWGPDLTQDAAVRRGRALAYQTRVDQITQQLKSESLEVADNQDSPFKVQRLDDNSSSHQIGIENSELLELEKRETIGEILKLNPSYKAPPDYKPLLKEAKVPIPVKQYPGYNFVSLIYGAGSDTKRRLEKETGAKIQVCGTKGNTGEKAEIIPSDGNEIQSAYEELHVNVSAETFEKVDAAVALIELLLTSVSGNLVAVSTSTSGSGDSVNVLTQSQDGATPYMVRTTVNQGVLQPVVGLTQATPENQFQYPDPWFRQGPAQTSMHPPSGFVPLSNSSAPILNNPVHLSSSHFNPSNLPSLFGPRPTSSTGFNSIHQNPSFVPPRPPHQPSQGLPHLYTLQTHPLAPPVLAQPSSAPPNMLVQSPFAGSQAPPTGPHPSGRPFMPSLPQSVSNVQPGPLLDRSFSIAGSSVRWSGPPAGPSVSADPSSSMVQTQSSLVSAAPPTNVSSGNIASPIFFPSRPPTPQLSSAAVNRPPTPVFGSVPAPQVGSSPAASLHQTPIPPPIQSSHSVMQVASATNSSVNPGMGSGHYPSPMPCTTFGQPVQSGMSGAGKPNFTPTRPPQMTLPKPQHPSAGDFTFHPHQLQNPAPQTSPRPSSHHTQNIPPSNPMVQPSAPQASSFQLTMHSQTPQPVTQMYPRPQISNQIGQPQAQRLSVPFAGNPTVVSVPPRLPGFPNASPVVPTNSIPQMGPRNYGPPMPNLHSPFPPRPKQNYPVQTARPGNFMPPNQQFNTNLSFGHGSLVSSRPRGQQNYDPFLPSSGSIASQQQQGGNHAKVRKQENDPEYEDLMASVGVK